MSDNMLIGVILGTLTVLLLVGGAISMWKDDRREQNIRNQAHEKLRGKQFVVAIRMKDGKRNYWETLFVKQLMDLGATVLDFSPEGGNHLWAGDRNQIPPGACAFVGTTWQEHHFWYIDGKFIPERNGLSPENGRVLAPFFSVHGDIHKLHMNLAECVRHYL